MTACIHLYSSMLFTSVDRRRFFGTGGRSRKTTDEQLDRMCLTFLKGSRGWGLGGGGGGGFRPAFKFSISHLRSKKRNYSGFESGIKYFLSKSIEKRVFMVMLRANWRVFIYFFVYVFVITSPFSL